MKFSVSQFLRNRMAGVPVSAEEEDVFEPFIVQVALERDPKVDDILLQTNTQSFFHLTKKQQAHAFDCLQGMRLNMQYNPTRGKRVAELKAEIAAYMKEFSMDYNSAKAIVLEQAGMKL